MATNAEKLQWLREHLPVRGVPDIYGIPGFRPNGCGPDNWKNALVHVVLNHLPGMPLGVEAAGDWHDYLYWLGGDEDDRVQADLTLFALLEDCKVPISFNILHPGQIVLSLLQRCEMRDIAVAYYEAVRDCGGTYFNYRGYARV